MSQADHCRSVTIGLVALLIAATLSGCATTGRQSLKNHENLVPTMGARGTHCCAMAKAVPRQTALAKTAVRFVGQSRVQIGGRHDPPVGVMRGFFAGDVLDAEADRVERQQVHGGLGELDGGNGVGRIFTHVVQHGRIHYGPSVHPGDLVFFHNTWDFNRDGLPNDPLTHVGVVEKVDSDGTVVFVSSVSAGIERYRMNLKHPDTHKSADGRVLNDFLRRKHFGDSPGTYYLTGRLFAAFGTLTH